MCPNKDLKKEDKGFMDFDLYKKIVDESRDFIFEINLAHRGESLMLKKTRFLPVFTQMALFLLRTYRAKSSTPNLTAYPFHSTAMIRKPMRKSEKEEISTKLWKILSIF